jgi:hypothetical protein
LQLHRGEYQMRNMHRYSREGMHHYRMQPYLLPHVPQNLFSVNLFNEQSSEISSFFQNTFLIGLLLNLNLL